MPFRVVSERLERGGSEKNTDAARAVTNSCVSIAQKRPIRPSQDAQ
jgi:hypothetical protein